MLLHTTHWHRTLSKAYACSIARIRASLQANDSFTGIHSVRNTNLYYVAIVNNRHYTLTGFQLGAFRINTQIIFINITTTERNVDAAWTIQRTYGQFNGHLDIHAVILSVFK